MIQAVRVICAQEMRICNWCAQACLVTLAVRRAPLDIIYITAFPDIRHLVFKRRTLCAVAESSIPRFHGIMSSRCTRECFHNGGANELNDVAYVVGTNTGQVDTLLDVRGSSEHVRSPQVVAPMNPTVSTCNATDDTTRSQRQPHYCAPYVQHAALWLSQRSAYLLTDGAAGAVQVVTAAWTPQFSSTSASSSGMRTATTGTVRPRAPPAVVAWLPTAPPRHITTTCYVCC